MSNNDEIIVRLTAEDSGLKVGMTESSDTVKKANAEMAASSEEASAAMTAASRAAAESAAEAAARIKAMVEASRAEMASLTAQASAVQPAAVGGGSTEALAADYAVLDGIMGRTAATGADLAMQEQALDRLMAAGALSAEQYGAALAALNEEEAALVAASMAQAEALAAETAERKALGATILGYTEEVAAAATAEVGESAALSENTAAQEANNAAVRSGAGARMHAMGVFGAMTRALQMLMTPLGLATAGIATLGIGAAVGADDESKLNNALLSTGNIAGTSAAEVEYMARNLASASVTVGQSTQALELLIRTGRFTSEELGTVADAAVNMANLTGESMQRVVQSIVSLKDDPVRALAKLNETQHLVTYDQFAQVIAFAKAGQAAEAYKAAIDDVNKAEERRAQLAQENLNGFGRSLQVLTHEPSMLWSGLKSLGQSSSLHDQLNEQLTRLENLQKAGEVTMTGGKYGLDYHRSSMPLAPFEVRYIQTTLDRYHQLQEEIHKATVAQHQHTQAVQHTDTAIKKALADYEKWAKEKSSLHGAHHATARAHPMHKQLPHLDAYAQRQMAQEYAAMQKATREKAQLQAVEEQSFFAHERAKTQIAEDAINQRLALGRISASQAMADKQKLEQALYAADMRELEKELQNHAREPVERARINAQIEAEQDRHEQRMQQLQHRTAQQTGVFWQSVAKDINQAIGTSVQGVVMGTETAAEATRRMGASVLAEIMSTQAQTLATAIETELGMTAAKEAGTAARLAIEEAAAIKSTLIHAEAAIKWIVTEAAKAISATIAAFAQLGPWGVVAGVAAGAAIGAEIMHLTGNVATAEGGWERVPADGMMTELHKDEQVLPAAYAEGLRNLIAQGGNGATNITHNHNYHISTLDTRSLDEYLRSHPGTLQRWAVHASRNGWATA